jgi:alpha-L-rhamnosidase
LIVSGRGGIVWDSGTVTLGDSVLVGYSGPALRSRERYSWTVAVRDDQGNEAASEEEAWFEMGLLDIADRWARWIEPEQENATRESKLPFFDTIKPAPPDFKRADGVLKPCQLLRREFHVSAPVRKARLWATAHGLYSLELNGRRLGDQELAPEATAYGQYLQYQTYDIGDSLVLGTNTVGIVLADGWWAGRVGLPGESCHYGDRLAAWLQVEIEQVDGSVQRWGSDGGFRSSIGPWDWADLSIGESYDARREHEGWTQAGFDDDAWRAVRVLDLDTHNFRAQYGEPVRALMELPAVKVLVTPRGETVVDFGQVVAGRVRMAVQGPAGTLVTLEHTEVLGEDGNYRYNIIGRNKDQRDSYVLKGEGEEVFEPRFTYHGFRYLRVTGYPGQVGPDRFTAVVLGSDLESTGDFACSDPRINQLQSNIVWSQRGNMVSIPTDAQIYAPTACFNADMAAFSTRWLRNVAQEQCPDGQVPMVVPYWSSYRGSAGGSDSSAGWGEVCIVVPWTLFERYGDIGVLEENWPTMTRWVEYCRRSAEEGRPEGWDAMSPERKDRQKYLWNTGFHFGDWMLPSVLEKSGGDPMQTAFATKELVATCLFAWSCELMARIALQLGKQAEAERYSSLNGRIRKAFAEEYLADDGRLAADYQGIYVLALKMRMVPEDSRERVLGHLAGKIEANGYCLDTGFVSMPFLLDVLCDGGRSDVAYRLLLQTECPSWLYEVERGATFIWEAWNAIAPDGKVGQFSFNHYSFGCVGDWMYRHIAGLRAVEPGYRHSIVAPDLRAPFAWARASLETPYGLLACSWKKEGASGWIEAMVPPNASATVHLPDGLQIEVRSGVHRFNPSPPAL